MLWALPQIWIYEALTISSFNYHQYPSYLSYQLQWVFFSPPCTFKASFCLLCNALLEKKVRSISIQGAMLIWKAIPREIKSLTTVQEVWLISRRVFFSSFISFAMTGCLYNTVGTHTSVRNELNDSFAKSDTFLWIPHRKWFVYNFFFKKDSLNWVQYSSLFWFFLLFYFSVISKEYKKNIYWCTWRRKLSYCKKLSLLT